MSARRKRKEAGLFLQVVESLKKPAQHKPHAAKLPTPARQQISPYGRYLDSLETDDAIPQAQDAFRDLFATGKPLPEEMNARLAIAFEYLCAGIADPLLTPVKRASGREEPLAKHMQKAAIRYLRWCEDGRLADPKPKGTVANSYGVTRRTVQRWAKIWKHRPTPPISPEFPPEAVRRFMHAEGKAYQRRFAKPKRT